MNRINTMLAVFFCSMLFGCGETEFTTSKAIQVNDTCFDQAAEYQGVNANLLRAIASTSNLITKQQNVTKERNGTVTYGVMGINDVNLNELSKYNISRNDLLDSCKNIYIGAWFLKKKIVQHGNNWRSVGTYFSETPHIRDEFSQQVYLAWSELK